MPRPLEGIKVLDLSTMLPGPLCTMMLADFGAEVIKIEPPKGGDLFRAAKPALKDTSGAYLLVNRNKKSLTLNLKSDQGREIFRRLAAEADVVVEGFRPGVVKRLGVDYDTLQAINPRLVYCSISGYGQDGPYAQYSGHDNNYISYAGILGMTARKGQVPTLPGVQVADVGGGTLMAIIGILMALMARHHTGKGQHVDISMLDGAIAWLPIIASTSFFSDSVPTAGSTKLTGSHACYEVYETKDDGFISLGPIEPHLWANLCRYFGKEEFIPWQNQLDKQDEMFAFLRAQFLTKDRDEWVRILNEVDVCIAPVLRVDEVFRDPQVLHRRMVFEMEHPRLGTIKQLGFPVKLSATPARAEMAPPDLGQHTDEILKKAGYSTDDLVALRQQGAI